MDPLGDHARITAVRAVGPFPCEVTAATLTYRIVPSTVESVNVVEVSEAPGVAT